MISPQITLHLGTFKTATTSLQRLLSNQRALLADGGVSLYAGDFDRSFDIIEMIHNYLRKSDYYMHTARQSLLQLLMPNQITEETYTHRLVSEEMLLGDLHAGPNLYGSQLTRFLTLLESIGGPPVNVVFVVRRLDQLLESHYLHNYAEGFIHTDFMSFYADLDMPRLSWCRVLDTLSASKAVGSVRVLTFEQVRWDTSGYVRAFYKACGLDPIKLLTILPHENLSITEPGYRLLHTLYALPIPLQNKAVIVNAIKNELRVIPGNKLYFLEEARRGLLRAWTEDTRELFTRWLPDAQPELLAYYLGELE